MCYHKFKPSISSKPPLLQKILGVLYSSSNRSLLNLVSSSFPGLGSFPFHIKSLTFVESYQSFELLTRTTLSSDPSELNLQQGSLFFLTFLKYYNSVNEISYNWVLFYSLNFSSVYVIRVTLLTIYRTPFPTVLPLFTYESSLYILELSCFTGVNYYPAYFLALRNPVKTELIDIRG